MRKINPDRLLAVLRENLGLKALSLFLALIIFYAIRSTISNRVVFSVPVEVKVDKGEAILEQDPRNVEVTFEGSRAELRRLAEESLSVVVSPPKGEDRREVPVLSRNVSAWRVARVVNIDPKVINVEYDKESRKIMPVARPTIKGTPLRGQLTVEYLPRMVEISGPRKQLEELVVEGYEVQTEPIDVEGRVQSFTRVVKLLPPEDIVVSAIEPSSVEVTITIETEIRLEEVPGLPVMAAYVSNTNHYFSFDPSNVVVRLAGHNEALAAVEADSLMALADCRGLDPGVHDIRVNVFVPPGVNLESASAVPPSVKVTVHDLLGSAATGRVDAVEQPLDAPESAAPADERE